MQDSEYRTQMLKAFKYNRVLAHENLFPHRHKDETPEFHREIIELFNSNAPLVALMAFRGAAKSTLSEEDVLLKALFLEEEFILIVGNSWSSACERLAPIKHELETNEELFELFGDQKSSPWAADEIVLANGVKIQAIGARQSMRGVKHNNSRPTYALIDDLEDQENVSTEEARGKTERWLTGTLMPSLNPKKGKIRFIGTPLHPKALIVKVCEDKNWESKKYPLFYFDENGNDQSLWPDRFSNEWVLKERDRYLNSGNMTQFEQEYMCRAEDIAGKPFQASMIRVEAAPQHYLPIDIIVDPARTVNQTRSARTGYVAASWLSNRLIVHEALGAFHRPDEIINTIFEWNQRFRPVNVGVETNALEEFIMQPLRARMLQSGISIPLVDLRAPKDKLSFIKGLQPFYGSGNVIHVKNLPDLESELLQFPTGRMDVPNALAYVLRMRAGRAVYEDFASSHIAPILEIYPGAVCWLVVSARPALVAAALVQYVDGVLRVYHDWAVNKPPVEALPMILREATMLSEGTMKVGTPVEQFDKYLNHGLVAAARRDGVEIKKLGYAGKSEGILKDWLTRRQKNDTAIMVADEARWTINGLSSGYARRLEKGGVLAAYPADNQYRVLVEAIEAFAASLNPATKIDDNLREARYAVASDGRRFLTSLPR